MEGEWCEATSSNRLDFLGTFVSRQKCHKEKHQLNRKHNLVISSHSPQTQEYKITSTQYLNHQ